MSHRPSQLSRWMKPALTRLGALQDVSLGTAAGTKQVQGNCVGKGNNCTS